jgi:protein-S-isoprenylcysteine O-methyltransferase Ste14
MEQVTMDPELYVFPKIENPAVKMAASTLVFAVVICAARLLLPGHGQRAAANAVLTGWGSLALGYAVFVYASVKAWVAMREKNTVEDAQRQLPTRLLDQGSYARVRHPMYAMFILANAGLGLAAHSRYGLIFSLLSVAAFVLNGIFEERATLIPLFGEQYRAYMRRVPARFFTPLHAALLALTLGLTLAVVLLAW